MDVLIIGAGPTGLTLAAELAARRIPFRIVDKAKERSERSRALGIHARTLELLQKMGIADELIAAGRQAVKLDAFVGGRRAFTADLGDIGALHTPYPFVLFVSQAETERVLEQRLERLGGRVERPVELIGLVEERGCVAARLRHGDGREEEARARYLIGCDGAHSTARQLGGLRFEGAPYLQDFVLADVEVAWEYEDGQVYAFFGKTGLLMALPLSGPSRFRLVAPRAALRGEGEPTLEEVEALARAVVPVPLRLQSPRWITRFRLHHRAVDRYRAGRLFVAGDAAHIHSPAGGQGMNTGIQDAYNLAWKLSFVAQERAASQDPGGALPPSLELLLDSYQDERRPVGRRLLRTTDRLFSLLATRSPGLIALRNFMLPRLGPLVLSTRAGRARAFRSLSQLAVRYRQSPIVAEDAAGADRAFRRGPRAGDRAPDGPLRTPEGAPAGSLFAHLTGTSHHLLIFAGRTASAPPDEGIEPLVRQAFSDLPEVRPHLILGRAPAPLELPPGALVDGGELHRRYGSRGPSVYLVRPDGYIAYRAPRVDIAAAAAHLRRVLSSDAVGPAPGESAREVPSAAAARGP